jgi:uncharacterized membrane protein
MAMLPAVTQAADTPFNDWDIVATSPWPMQVHALVAVVIVAALALSWTSTRGAPPRLRVGLLSLRVLFGVLLVVVLLEPGRRLLATSKEPDRVVVAVDTSASMAVGTGSDQRIRAAARAALAVVDDVSHREPPFAPEVWLFDDTVQKASVDDLHALADGSRTPTGAATRLVLPLDAAGGSDDPGGVGAPLGGVVVVSDGGDTTGLQTALSADVRERAGRLGGTPGAPLHTVVVGADAGFQDVVVERVVADEFAFVRNPMNVEVTLRQRGYGDQSVPVTLAEDGVVVARNEIGFGGESSAKTTFTFTPQRAGKHLYTVQAAVLAGEAIAENNRADFTAKMIRDRIRVLQVAGRPSWDERFVRRLLKENPSVDLISFFILRSTTDISGAPNSEMSLIPFPTKELFTEQLNTFDVVIFQDFNYRPYQMGIYLQNVADYVKNGGGFLMLGGDLSFSEGDYDGSPVADVLPVRLRPGHGQLDTEDFVPVVTDAGRRHPVTDVVGFVDGAASTNPFSSLPPLQGMNLVAGLAPDAVALLTHPTLNDDDGQAQPVIAVRDVGKGRSVAILTDTTWHWALPQAASGRGTSGDAHRKLLANTLRWLIRDPELSHVKLTLDARGDISRGVEPGAPVTAEVRAFDARYDAEAGAKLKLTLLPLDTMGARQAPVVVQGETGADGTFRAPLVPTGPGAWRVRVEVDKDGQPIGVDEDVFVVRAASLERLYGEARPDLLASLAAAGGGQSVGVDDVKGLPFVDHGHVRVHRQKTEPLWNRPVVLAALALLAAGEWWWRRRRGFA